MVSPLSTPQVLALGSRPAAFVVLSDPQLFNRITSFQGGIPVEVYAFWRTHDGGRTPRLSSPPVHALLARVIESGTTHHLDLLRSSQWYMDGAWRRPNIARITPTGVSHRRLDVLAWMQANDIHVDEPREVWKRALENASIEPDLKMIELLYSYTPLPEPLMDDLVRRTTFTLTIPLVEWLTTAFPTLTLPRKLTLAAVQNGDLATLRYIIEHRASQGCDLQAFSEAYEKRHLEILEFLIMRCADTMEFHFKEKIIADPEPRIQALIVRFPSVFTLVVRKQR